jgi:hypothetical protein
MLDPAYLAQAQAQAHAQAQAQAQMQMQQAQHAQQDPHVSIFTQVFVQADRP